MYTALKAEVNAKLLKKKGRKKRAIVFVYLQTDRRTRQKHCMEHHLQKESSGEFILEIPIRSASMLLHDGAVLQNL